MRDIKTIVRAVAIVALALAACGDNKTAPAPLGFSNSSNGPQVLKLRPDLGVVALSAVTSLPIPSGGNAGASLATWSNGLGYPPDAIIKIKASATTTLTGPVGIYGGSTADAKEYYLGQLNSGADINMLTATMGYSEKVTYVGVFDYLTIGGVSGTITPSGGANVTVTMVPIEY